MDQSGNNMLFVQVYLNDIYEKLNEDDLSQKLMDELNRDHENENNPISDLESVLQNIKEQSAKNMFILMQFTKERTWTNYLANVFEKLGQTDLANKLIEYNKSEKFRSYDDKDALKVRKRIATKSGTTMCYIMESNPRGVVFIVINEPELETEAKAFENVFKQLHFQVQLYRRLSAEQIRQLFKKAAKNRKIKKMDALVTVCIGHGQNESFLGRNFDKNKEDHVLISELIDQFSNKEETSKVKGYDKDKPIIHLFNCCRVQTDNTKINLDKYEQENWRNNNANTTIIYACSKRNVSEYHYNKKKREGWSFFGQAFICTLAQFAHHLNFEQILNKTNQRLRAEGNHRSLPQVVKQSCRFELYFNPGFCKDKSNSKKRGTKAEQKFAENLHSPELDK